MQSGCRNSFLKRRSEGIQQKLKNIAACGFWPFHLLLDDSVDDRGGDNGEENDAHDDHADARDHHDLSPLCSCKVFFIGVIQNCVPTGSFFRGAILAPGQPDFHK